MHDDGDGGPFVPTINCNVKCAMQHGPEKKSVRGCPPPGRCDFVLLRVLAGQLQPRRCEHPTDRGEWIHAGAGAYPDWDRRPVAGTDGIFKSDCSCCARNG